MAVGGCWSVAEGRIHPDLIYSTLCYYGTVGKISIVRKTKTIAVTSTTVLLYYCLEYICTVLLVVN